MGILLLKVKQFAFTEASFSIKPVWNPIGAPVVFKWLWSKRQPAGNPAWLVRLEINLAIFCDMCTLKQPQLMPSYRWFRSFLIRRNNCHFVVIYPLPTHITAIEVLVVLTGWELSKMMGISTYWRLDTLNEWLQLIEKCMQAAQLKAYF